MRLSVTARIALLAIILSLVSNLALIGFVWKQTSADAIDAIRRETTEQSDALRTVWQVGGIGELRQAIGEAVRPGDVSLVLALIDADGRMVEGVAPARLTVPLRMTRFRIAPRRHGGGRGRCVRPAGGATQRHAGQARRCDERTSRGHRQPRA